MTVCPADLDKLQQEEVAHICEWLTEKVDSYSTRLNPEPKDEPEEVRSAATVSVKSLQVLRSCRTVMSAEPLFGVSFSSSSIEHQVPLSSALVWRDQLSVQMFSSPPSHRGCRFVRARADHPVFEI